MIELELKLDIMKRILSIRLNVVVNEQWKNIVITKSSKCIGCIKG